MSEFIGSRISLVSRSDIRYVGTLHEINSETSTVALENVSSFGTEGRKGSPEDEIPPSDQVYEYIVFRGSDVKDLRIEEAPAVKENKPPQIPNDPAILGSGSRPQAKAPTQPSPPAATQNQQQQAPSQGQSQPGQPSQPPAQGPPGGPPGPHQFPQHPQYPPQFYPPPPGQWGRGGPPGPGYPGMPYGAPPGWYPPPGQQFGPFGYGGFPPGPPGPPGGPPGLPPGFPSQQPPPQQQKPAPIGPTGNKQQATPAAQMAPVEKPAAEPKIASKPSAQTTTTGPVKAGASAESSKPVEQEKIPSQPTSFAAAAAKKPAPPAGPKNGRIVPAVPLQSPQNAKAPLQSSPSNAHKLAAGPSTSTAANSTAVEDATKAATAAVAAAMAKLPPLGGQQTNGSSAVDNLTRKVNEMRTNDTIRAPRQPGAGGGFRGERGDRSERGRGRGGRGPETRKVEVPTTDFDFESSNAKFNKQDLVKEAIAGSPLGEDAPTSPDDNISGESAVPAAASYNKKSSFFDDLSSDNKDRAEGGRPGGREWRGEEQKKNLETFGQGSVDNGGYRGGFRGRGRGRGGIRGRGYGGNGQPGVRGGRGGGYRGGRGDFSTVEQ